MLRFMTEPNIFNYLIVVVHKNDLNDLFTNRTDSVLKLKDPVTVVLEIMFTR